MATSDYSSLGKRLAALRRVAKLSQNQLADKAKVADSTLAKIERGAIKEPSVFTIARLARVLGISVDELLDHRTRRHGAAAKRGEVRFIYFDIHGVITTNWERIFTELAARFHLEPQAVEMAFWRYNDLVGRGHMTLPEFETALAHNLLIKSKRLPYVDVYFDAIRGDPHVHALMRELTEHYQIGLFSNIFPGFLGKLLKLGIVPTLPYGATIESCAVGAVKPEPAIYEYAQREANVPAGQILLIDDTHANIDTAQHLGWQGSWFDDQHPVQSITALRTRLLPDS